MKTPRYTASALSDLKRHASVSARIRAKVAAYAATGAGNVVEMVGMPGLRRLRVGDFRVIFRETETEITVTRIGPRGSVYE